jgi:hypothetical protein
MPSKRILLRPDGDLANADWIKQSWELPFEDADALRAFLRSRGTTVRAFKALPVYRNNLDKHPWLRDL